MNNKLLSYALLAQAGASLDTSNGLRYLVMPIARKYAGKEFDQAKFCTEFLELYGIELDHWVADSLSDHLLKVDVLTQYKVDQNNYQLIYAAPEQEDLSVSEGDVTRIVESFLNFSKGKISQEIYDKEILKQAFFNRLTRMEFLNILAKPSQASSKNSRDWTSADEKESKLDVLVASYILFQFNNNKSAFEMISNIASGAVLSRYVLDVKNPGSHKSLKGLTLFLDTTLLMMYLDLDSQEDYLYAKKLVEKLIKHGAQISVFEQTVNEMRKNIYAVQHTYDNNRRAAHGPTAKRMVETGFRPYLQSVYNSAEKILKKKGIRVQPSINGQNHFGIKDKEKMIRQLSGKLSTAEHDAQCLSDVINIRRGKKVNFDEFEKSGSILLTTNLTLVRRSRDFLVENSFLSPRKTMPIVSVKTISGLIWAIFGAEGKELSIDLLIVNCTRALTPSDDLVNRVYEVLEGKDSDQLDMFESLMTDNRASHHLTSATSGDPNCVSTNSISEILEGVKLASVEKVQASYEEKTREIENKARQADIRHEQELRKVQEEKNRELVQRKVEKY